MTMSEHNRFQTTTEPPPAAATGVERPPVPAEPAAVPAHKPDGPLAAMLLAAGIGVFCLGLVTTLAEANATVKDVLTLTDRVGPLSGKALVATALFLVSAVVLVPLLAARDGLLRRATLAFVVLTALGYVGTFPTVFQAFE